MEVKCFGKPVTLLECPPGLFVFDDCLGVKTEYGHTVDTLEVYVAESGEVFWGGTSTKRERARLLVTPATSEE